jgi:hypothetical protein
MYEFRIAEQNLPDEACRVYQNMQRDRVRNKLPLALAWDDFFAKESDDNDDEFATGDLVLMRGSGIGSVAIRAALGGEWSHVGMIYVRKRRNPDTGKLKRHILLFESVSHADEGIYDVISGECKGGVRLVDLKQRLIQCDSPYYGIVKLGPDQRSLSDLRSDGHMDDEQLEEAWRRRAQKRFSRFAHQEYTKTYEPHYGNLMHVAFDCVGSAHAHDRESFFCSKLIAETYIEMGLLPDKIVAGEVAPRDFWSYQLPLQHRKVIGLYYMARIGELQQNEGVSLARQTENEHQQLMALRPIHHRPDPPPAPPAPTKAIQLKASKVDPDDKDPSKKKKKHRKRANRDVLLEVLPTKSKTK